MRDKINIPPMEDVIKHNDKNDEENNEKSLKEDEA